MQSCDLGDLHTLSALFQVESVPGDSTTLIPADPTTVVLRVRDPVGIISTPTPTRDALGMYHADIVVDRSGIWFYRWEGSGSAADNGDGQFFVRPSKVVAG